MNKTVAIIGAGRVGGAMGFLLRKAGYGIGGVVTRSLASAEKAVRFIGSGKPETDVAAAAAGAEIVLITTPDGAIKEVCDAMAEAFRPGALIVHTSGAHTLGLLEGARKKGARRAVIHPLQSVPTAEQGVRTLPGSYYRIEADPQAGEEARAIVKALDGIELELPKWQSDAPSAALYHAGAVAVSNYFVALVDYGLRFYETLGADKSEALRAVLPLIRGTLRNLEALGTTGALTGPISRGDAGTLRGHLDAMRERAPELLALYRALAIQTVSVALAKGTIDQQKAEELLKLLTD